MGLVIDEEDKCEGIAIQPPLRSTKEKILQLSNIVKSFLGSNWLRIPFCFSISGILLGSFLVIIVGILTDYTCGLLVQAKTIVNAHIERKHQNRNTLPNGARGFRIPPGLENEKKPFYTFGGLVGCILGPNWKILIDILLCFSLCGFCIGYFIFMTETVLTLFSLSTSSLPHRGIVAFVISLFETPVVFLKDLKLIGFGSVFGWLAIVIGMFLTMITFDLKEKNEAKLFDLDGFPLTLAMLAASFEGIGMVLPVQHDMKNYGNPPGSLYGFLLRRVLIGVCTCFVVFGLMGYMSFGEQTDQIITLNLAPGPMATLVHVSLVIAIFFTVPLVLFPASETVALWLYPEESFYTKDTVFADWRRCCVTSVLLNLTALIAVLIPQPGPISGIVGSIGGATLAYIIPGLMAIKLFKLRPLALFFHLSLILFGVFILLFGTYSSLAAIYFSFEE